MCPLSSLSLSLSHLPAARNHTQEWAAARQQRYRNAIPMFTPRRAAILSKRRTSTDAFRPGQPITKSDLQELDEAITRIDELIKKLRQTISECRGITADESNIGINPTPPHNSNFIVLGQNSRQGDGTVPQNASSTAQHQKSSFIPISLADEEELIELLRRTAELVVQGERRASAIGRQGIADDLLSKTPSASIPNDLGKTKANPDQQPKRSHRDKDLDDKERERQAHSSLFDLFLERNVLSTIVSLVTGASFSHTSRKITLPKMTREDTLGTKNVLNKKNETGSSTNGNIEPLEKLPMAYKTTSEENLMVYLPPISVATQAVQSTAILIQNVSQATSLYMLLSNNRVNDLIGLPLDLYINALEQRDRMLPSKSAGSREKMESSNQVTCDSQREFPEIAELATHFVSFLKSLVVRINLETLQFYIRYASDPKTHISSESDGSFIHSTSNIFPSNSSLKSSNMLNDTAVDFQTEDIEFPLYARALEFCSANQDSFVRLTAMNICLNTLRLATVSSQMKHWTHEKERSEAPKSPMATIESINLPFRERIAIAHHICHPDRVKPFIRPIFCRLEYLVEALKDALRAIETKNTKDLDGFENVELEAQTLKIAGAAENIAIDMQDELLLLDDVLKMGLTPLNEQIIEMMLSTYVYPVLLKPLFSSVDCQSTYEGETAEAFERQELSENAHRNPLGQVKNPNCLLDPIILKSSSLGLYSIFNTITNLPLLRIIFTALFHPKTPDETSAFRIVTKPSVVTPANSDLQLRVDVSPNRCFSYDFGRSKRADSFDHSLAPAATGKGLCIFVLSPCLSNILDNIGFTKTRPNKYRNMLLECMTGKNGTDLQKVAVLPFAAAVEALGEFAEVILYGQKNDIIDDSLTGQINEPNRSDVDPIGLRNNSRNVDITGITCDKISDIGVSNALDFAQSGREIVVTLLAALTSCVATSTDCVNGVWRLDYNTIAARALLRVINQKTFATHVASKLLKHRKQKSALFLSQLPALVDVGFVDKFKTAGPMSISETQDEQQLNLIMDRIVRDAWDGKEGCTLDFLLRKEIEEGVFALSVAVAEKCSLPQACKDIVTSRKIIVSEGMDAAMSCAADSALAHFQLDALTAFASSALKSRKVIFVEDTNFSSLSTELTSAICDQHEDALCDECPNAGDVVDLVGKVAFPCVCEVNKASQALFTDQRACVVADGVRWQSLYLVFYNSHMLLVEPVKQGVGGTGRVVTFCCLACLKVSKDKAPLSNSQFSARRLILRHESLDPIIPGVFSSRGAPHGSVITRSRMDLWFENDDSAIAALETFFTKIYLERARRGKHLRDELIKMSNQ